MSRSPETLLEQFEKREIEPGTFRHRDHVALAWAMLRRGSPLLAMESYIEGLRHLASSAGHPEIYHATITWAFLLLIQEHIGRNPAASWQEFESANGDLFTWQPSVLERYYQPETLTSDLARAVFLLPDRLALS